MADITSDDSGRVRRRTLMEGCAAAAALGATSFGPLSQATAAINGELGICGGGASVANAVYNATCIRIWDFPLTLDKILDGFAEQEWGEQRRT